MNKTELLEEAMREGLPVLPTWNLEKIRSVVREHRAIMDSLSPEANLKGIGSMTLAQLKTLAEQHGIVVPEKATRGLLMRLVRAEVENADEMIAFRTISRMALQGSSGEVPPVEHRGDEPEQQRFRGPSQVGELWPGQVQSEGVPQGGDPVLDGARDQFNGPLSRKLGHGIGVVKGVDGSGFELGSGTGNHDEARLPEEQGRDGDGGQQRKREDRGLPGRDRQEGDLRLGGETGDAETAAWNSSTAGLRSDGCYDEDEIFHDALDEEYHDALEFPDLDGDYETEPKAFQAYPTEVFEDEDAENYLFCDGDHVRRDRQPIFWEVYAGKGGLADAMEKLGYKVQRFDLPDWNFELLSDRRRLWRLYIEQAPDIVWIAPPCTLWSPLQTWNKDLGALEVLWTRRSYDHRTHLSMTRRLYKGQMKRKKIGVVEHPWTSSAWRTPAFKGLGGHSVDLDQCAFGSTLPNNEGVDTPIQKRTCLKVTYQELVPLLHRKCPGGHVHQHVVGSLPAGGGSRAKAAGAYQHGFCGEVAAALDKVFYEGECTSSEVQEVVDHALLEHETDHDHISDAEEIARMASSRNDFSFATLAKVADSIDAAKHHHRRHKKDGKLTDNEFAFTGGLWQFGGKHGITKGTFLYPNVCCYLNEFFRSRGYSGWTSFYLRKNIQTTVHTDHHNMRGTESITVTFAW